MWPRTREEMKAKVQKELDEEYGPPELFTDEARKWGVEKAELVRASVAEGETLRNCYRRMFRGIRKEAEERFPGCGCAWISVGAELNLGSTWLFFMERELSND